MKADIVLIISSENPLDLQLRNITGEEQGFANFSYLKGIEDESNRGAKLLQHHKTGLVVAYYNIENISF